MADAVGTVAGSMMGTSTITSFVESSAGVAEGGKTGLTAMTTGFMFLSFPVSVTDFPCNSGICNSSGADYCRIFHGVIY